MKGYTLNTELKLIEVFFLCLIIAIFMLWEHIQPTRKITKPRQLFDIVALINISIFSLLCKWLLTPSIADNTATVLAYEVRWPRFLISIIIVDFILYWLHRWMHGPYLWKTHRFHHSVTDLNWIKGIYTSGTHIVLYVLPQLIVGYHLMKLNALEMLLAFILSYFIQMWQHANITVNIGLFKYIFVTPQSHRLHHSIDRSDSDTNYGAIFSFWDVLFRTFKYPKNENYLLGIKGKVPLVRGLIGF